MDILLIILLVLLALAIFGGASVHSAIWIIALVLVVILVWHLVAAAGRSGL